MHYMSYLFRITSAAISNDGQLMCAGFEDSAVRLWSLTPKKLVVNQASFHDLSRINFGIGLNSKFYPNFLLEMHGISVSV